MFSLKSDLLFPSVEMAKALVRKLNPPRKSLDHYVDARELMRMQRELHEMRDRVMLNSVGWRNLMR
ncbi:hypothetical protein [Aestuariivirga sp.]|uniref:hypothetical protein n=1 Tax=Aestuariivirga sp. TaxID=2650926 RepID=UPI0039E32E6B